MAKSAGCAIDPKRLAEMPLPLRRVARGQGAETPGSRCFAGGVSCTVGETREQQRARAPILWNARSWRAGRGGSRA
jgi:hypothetical protein